MGFPSTCRLTKAQKGVGRWKALQFQTSFPHISQGQIVKGCYHPFIGFIIMKPYIYIYILVMFFFCACLSLLESLRQVISFGDRGWGECWPGPSNWIKGVSCISRCFRWKCCCRILSLRTDIIHNNSSFGFFPKWTYDDFFTRMNGRCLFFFVW